MAIVFLELRRIRWFGASENAAHLLIPMRHLSQHTHTRAHSMLANSSQRGLTWIDASFSRSDHLFICGSPFFVAKIPVLFCKFDARRLRGAETRWESREDENIAVIITVLREAVGTRSERGEQEATSPPAKINLSGDHECSILMSVHSHVLIALLIFWPPARKN